MEAKRAKAITLEALSGEVSKIDKLITEEAKKGNSSIIVSDLSKEIREILRSNGFNVMQGVEAYTYRISWNLS